MQSNEQILSAIENYLAQADFPAEPELLYAPIGYSLAGGGKRLRPMLLMLAHGIFSDDMQQALPAAAASAPSPATQWRPPEASVRAARLSSAAESLPKPREWRITSELLIRASSSS